MGQGGRPRWTRVVSFVLPSLLCLAALGLLLGQDHGAAAGRPLTGHGSAELEASTTARIPGRPDPVEPAGRGSSKKFRVEVTDIRGLFPGSSRPLTVALRNDNPFDIWVTQVSTDGRGVAGCSESHLVTGSHEVSPRIRVPARSGASAQVPFGMRTSAPESCQAATFEVTVRATAVRK